MCPSRPGSDDGRMSLLTGLERQFLFPRSPPLPLWASSFHTSSSAPSRRPGRHPSSSEEGSFKNSPPDSGGVAPRAPGWLPACRAQTWPMGENVETVAQGEPAVGCGWHTNHASSVGAASRISCGKNLGIHHHRLRANGAGCRRLRGLSTLPVAVCPRLARRGPHDATRFAGFMAPPALNLTPMAPALSP
jgi:hypothetical protein